MLRQRKAAGQTATDSAVILATVAAIALVALLWIAPAALAQEAEATGGGFAERPEAEEEYSELVDEDEQFAPKQQTYAFNPVQARKELKVGNYYAKKGSFRAAAGRYEEATRWDTNFAEAYWRLGTALEKLGRRDDAIAAYTSYLRVEPASKKARSVRRSLEQLQQSAERLPLSAEDSENRELTNR